MTPNSLLKKGTVPLGACDFAAEFALLERDCPLFQQAAKSSGADDSLTLAMARRIDAVRDDFEAALRSGGRPRIEDFLGRLEEQDRSHALAELVELECDYRRESGERPNAEEYRARFPRQGDLFSSTFGPKAPDETAAGQRRRRDSAEVLAHRRAGVPLHRVGDYELLEVVAEGGMGTVYRARQLRLGRVVAVKVIRAARFASREDIERFTIEAQAAAQLQHPGIVAIHEIGEHDGVRFFSMEYVEGESLAERLADGTFAAMPAARLVADVADAVHFAHERGVLHRDLKPSNILLDRKERPRVVDFGLAKRIVDDSGLTATGQVLGTPSYMPPEQARGECARMDARADVYAVGAVLYEMLTGRPPFRGSNAWDTIRQVVENEPAAPRLLNAAIPRDLETICRKCLDKRPEHRYATAAALADDLRRFTRGEPIVARPLGRLLRAARWTRRNRTVAALSAAVISTLLIGTAVSIWFAVEARQRADEVSESAGRLRRERDRADGETQRAKQQEQFAATERDRAKAALAETRRVIGQYVDTVRNAELFKEERFKPLLRELLADALAHYERYIDEYAHEGGDRAELVRSFTAVGSLSFIQGDVERARRSFERALEANADFQHADVADDLHATVGEAYKGLAVVELETGNLAAAARAIEGGVAFYGRLANEHPTNREFRHELARLHRMSGNVKRRGGDIASAAKAYRKAVDIEEALIGALGEGVLANDAPRREENANRAELAYALNLLASGESDLGHSRVALATHDRAIAVARRLVADEPFAATYRSILAETYGGRARTLADIGDSREAAKAYGEAIALQRVLAAERPTVREYRDGLAANHLNLGNEQQRTGDFDGAAASYDTAIAIATELSREHPTVGKYRENLAMAHTNLGVLLRTIGRTDAAAESLTKAIELLEALAAESPRIADHRENLARSYCNLGAVRVQCGDAAAGAASFRKSIRILEQLVTESPQDAYFSVLALGYHNLAIAERADGDRDRGVALNVKATAIYDRLAAADPTVADYRMGAAVCRYQLGISQKEAGNLASAGMALAKAVELYGDLTKQHPNVGVYRGGLAGGLFHLGELHLRWRRWKSALEFFDRAIDAYTPLVREGKASGEHRFGLAASYRHRALTLHIMGDEPGAIVSLRQAIESLTELAAGSPTMGRYRKALGDAKRELAEMERRSAAISSPASP